MRDCQQNLQVHWQSYVIVDLGQLATLTVMHLCISTQVIRFFMMC